MTRLLLDTNIYTAILKDPEAKQLILKSASYGFRFYGFAEIRHELKAAPRLMDSTTKNLRADLLRLYEAIIAKEYEFDQRMMDLAIAYYQKYREFGGKISHKDILTDFLIIACGAIKQLDVVVSQDSNSMLNAYARESYEAVNTAKGLATPKLWTYEELKKQMQAHLPDKNLSSSSNAFKYSGSFLCFSTSLNRASRVSLKLAALRPLVIALMFTKDNHSPFKLFHSWRVPKQTLAGIVALMFIALSTAAHAADPGHSASSIGRKFSRCGTADAS